jgi:hypothetical protein
VFIYFALQGGHNSMYLVRTVPCSDSTCLEACFDDSLNTPLLGKI